MELLEAKLRQPEVCRQKVARPETLKYAAFFESVKETGEFLSYPMRPQDDAVKVGAVLDEVEETVEAGKDNVGVANDEYDALELELFGTPDDDGVETLDLS
jgi:hypothetical protein